MKLDNNKEYKEKDVKIQYYGQEYYMLTDLDYKNLSSEVYELDRINKKKIEI